MPQIVPGWLMAHRPGTVRSMDVDLTPTGPPETVLPDPEPTLIERIENAGSSICPTSR